jgi:SAM-dependent methyltransferase
MSEDLRESVRQKYAQIISGGAGCGCGIGCCGGEDLRSASAMIIAGHYQGEETAGIPAEAVDASLGCGNPTALAELREGEVVLDLGSGAGLDVLLSARRVGPTGKAYGLDMTDEMLAAARTNQARSGLTNVEFLRGHIEDIPLPPDTVDVIISNCVINLSADKKKVLREAFRVLKPGGRLAVSDIVLTRPLPEKVQQDLAAWTGCIAGALLDSEYRGLLESAGFTGVEVETTRVFNLSDPMVRKLLPGMSEAEMKDLEGALTSSFIRAVKP